MNTEPKGAGAPVQPPRDGLIVGVGASAGGLDAFKAFFARMPADTGMAFILVQHLDPSYQSSLGAIVGGYTAMPVQVAEDGAAILPNHVYIIPPDAILTVDGSRLHVTAPAPQAARRTSVDIFLASLAEDQGMNAVGIILSGFGSDGARGVAAIKEHGGLTLSQAEFDHHAKSGMPRSAALGGFVDHVLAVEDMPAALLEYLHHRANSDAAKGPDGIRQDLPGHLTTICAVLHARLGHDFSQYKVGTLMRRIQRRMHVLHADEVPAYVELLRTQPNEADLLFHEILISVTRFFRDPPAFGALETQVLSGLLTNPGTADPVRVWVAGCATGEEAYSIAILLREGLLRTASNRPVQIFATDMDELAIQTARAGLYPTTIAADLSPERLEQHFVKEDGHYRVAKTIREMCLFSVHDIARDPPFSKIDLVSCRNMLIYFTPELQHRIFATFHYALRPGGHLLLGTSESIAVQSRLFAPVDKRQRLYLRRDTAASFPPVSVSRSPEHLMPAKRAPRPADSDIDRRAARAIARYAPAYLVVDRHHEILRFSGQTGKYLEPAAGAASLNLFQLLHTDLRPVVRAALNQATETESRVLRDGVTIMAGGQHVALTVIVEPLPDPTGKGGLFLVAFQEAPAAPVSARTAPADERGQDRDTAADALMQELLETRERLRNTTEELEAANEELQSSNEEYLSVNEELQSTNEELETSKEELQSVNEELQTINAELNIRNDTLARSNSDLANLFDSTSIATLFLDKDLRIRRFTPRLLEIFKLREGDEGRPISDIVSRLANGGLGQDVQQVLRSLIPIEREVTIADDAVSYLMQVRPYRDINDVIDGTVITFVDISERKRHERARARLAAIVESSQDAILSTDLDGTITSWNPGAEMLCGYTAAEAIGQPLSVLLAGSLPADWPHMMARLEKGEPIAGFESVRTTKGGRTFDVSITISPVREVNGKLGGASVVMRDISERKAAEHKTTLLLGELDHRVKNILAIVSSLVTQMQKAGLPPEVFAAELRGRIQSIAQAHGLLSKAERDGMSLGTILKTELAPYHRPEGDITLAGPDIGLTPKAGLAVALAVHELATNAAKYGALSLASGHLAVIWKVEDDGDRPRLLLTWTEAGGPPVQPPAKRGFGTTLIERALTMGFDAVVRREFPESGLRCAIEIPLTEDVGKVRRAADTGGTSDGH
ncbi:PAS domain S-box protein [Rhodovastum atsumiense]|uniref:histidine kinase n=1 Tax=Rhodovastum atsumiense TaxID=504468 RepID=A0A5M6IKH7_9PROT|nr:CheR family methyltransferase [Rhodovastum atsumiense]KAA5608756.1 PAS domain S-box protein [Rhodovastum atsumiense]CAH2603032.1 PAS domain S-box protein [Rhodovastum atsumiense]